MPSGHCSRRCARAADTARHRASLRLPSIPFAIGRARAVKCADGAARAPERLAPRLLYRKIPSGALSQRASVPTMAMAEKEDLQPGAQESLQHVTDLLRKQQIVEGLVRRQEGPRQELVENLVQKLHVVELQK